MEKTVLVTGANGFVGSHILEALAGRPNVRPIAACRDRARLPPDYTGEIREGDLRNDGYRKAVVSGVDVVCHGAAWTSLWGHADESRARYLEPTLALIRVAQAAGVKRFLNTSTTSAAAPEHASDPMSPGINRALWPHLNNVIAIENALREYARPDFQCINLRLGIFAGRRYGLGLLPILVPRLKTHLVPWVGGGRTSLPIIDGRDIGRAFALASVAEGLDSFESFNIVGPTIPTVRQVITLLHNEFGLPVPHFGVPFAIGYGFAALMEKLDRWVPWEPLVTRSIIHLMEEVAADNSRAENKLNYVPQCGWEEAVRAQMAEMQGRELKPMSMARPLT